MRFEITNISCAGCAARAERAMAGLANTRQVQVNPATHMAEVEGGTAPALQAALTKAGYPAREARFSLMIEGMSCASCVGRIEEALRSIPGVLKASVNPVSGQAKISALSPAVTAQKLAAKTTGIGYPARVIEDQTEDKNRSRHNAEQAILRRDLIRSIALTLPVFLGVMGGHVIPAVHEMIMAVLGMRLWWLVQFILTTAVLIGPGWRFARIGLPHLLRGAPDMNSLVALGTLAAWGYSTLVLFAPALFPENARHVYFEAAAVIVTLILLGRWLEARARGRTGAAIEKLIGLRPQTARIMRENGMDEVPLSDITEGDVLHIRPGERFAVDGEVLTGQSHVDESMLTGEALLVVKTPGARVTGGTINGQGTLTYRADAVGADTALARIIAMVEQAQGAKLPVQALTDKVVRQFVPAVLVLALLTVVLWLILGPGPTHALIAGISVLIIACPCAMGLAVPVSIMVGVGRGAQLGVLFRNGSAMQSLSTLRVIGFDKTGTLTLGQMEVVSQSGPRAEEALRLAASAEAGSEHPIARALERAAHDMSPVEEVETIAGHGLRARVDGYDVLVGSSRLMAREGIEVPDLDAAQTPVYVAIDGVFAGLFGLADQIRPGAREMIQALHGRRFHVAMITGDTAQAANDVARQLAIDHVEAGILPDAKQGAIRNLRARYGAVGFVGDGINDAPALAEADVGLAIGTGTDVAIETGDVVLVSGDPAGVMRALTLSKAVMRNIRQNLFWAFAYNVALIPVAAGALYPLGGIMLSPMLAAGVMALSSVFVISNALRLRGFSW